MPTRSPLARFLFSEHRRAMSSNERRTLAQRMRDRNRVLRIQGWGLIVIAVVLTFMAETVGPLQIILGIVSALLLVVAALRRTAGDEPPITAV